MVGLWEWHRVQDGFTQLQCPRSELELVFPAADRTPLRWDHSLRGTFRLEENGDVLEDKSRLVFQGRIRELERAELSVFAAEERQTFGSFKESFQS
jgi:hypothetical protein